MAIGPVQLLVIGSNPRNSGRGPRRACPAPGKQRGQDHRRATLYKDPEGVMNVIRLSNLSEDESIEFGAKVGALIGLGVAGEEGFILGAELGALAGEEGSRSSPTTRRRTS